MIIFKTELIRLGVGFMEGEEKEGWVSNKSQARSTMFIGVLRTERWSPRKEWIPVVGGRTGMGVQTFHLMAKIYQLINPEKGCLRVYCMTGNFFASLTVFQDREKD